MIKLIKNKSLSTAKSVKYPIYKHRYLINNYITPWVAHTSADEITWTVSGEGSASNTIWMHCYDRLN